MEDEERENDTELSEREKHDEAILSTNSRFFIILNMTIRTWEKSIEDS